jgi:hypothetical protein
MPSCGGQHSHFLLRLACSDRRSGFTENPLIFEGSDQHLQIDDRLPTSIFARSRRVEPNRHAASVAVKLDHSFTSTCGRHPDYLCHAILLDIGQLQHRHNTTGLNRPSLEFNLWLRTSGGKSRMHQYLPSQQGIGMRLLCRDYPAFAARTSLTICAYRL